MLEGKGRLQLQSMPDEGFGLFGLFEVGLGFGFGLLGLFGLFPVGFGFGFGLLGLFPVGFGLGFGFGFPDASCNMTITMIRIRISLSFIISSFLREV